MAKSTDSNNEADPQQGSAANYAAQMVIFPNQNLNITKDCKLKLLEFLGLGKVDNYQQNNFQVKEIKVGKKLIDVSDHKEIFWIKRSADNLKLYCYSNKEELYYSSEYNTEHCDAVFTGGNNNDYNPENN